jgi:hypothetical protein
MHFLTKIIHFFKNFHPIRSFAKPIQRTEVNSEPIIISYEALTRELAQPAEQVRYEAIPAYSIQETYQHARLQAPEDSSDDGEIRERVMLIPKVEISNEMNFMLEPADVLEAPIAGETTIGELVAGTEAEEIVAEASEITVETVVSVEEVQVKEPRSTHEATEGKAKKQAKTRKTAVAKPTTKAKSTKVTSAKKVVKKAAVTKKAAAPRRRKNTPPPEAMGFGF